ADHRGDLRRRTVVATTDTTFRGVERRNALVIDDVDTGTIGNHPLHHIRERELDGAVDGRLASAVRELAGTRNTRRQAAHVTNPGVLVCPVFQQPCERLDGALLVLGG